jgi:hypothetical protein
VHELDELEPRSIVRHPSARPLGHRARPRPRGLTRRQAELLGHLVVLAADGRPVKGRALARAMRCSVASARSHLEQVYVRGYVLGPGFPAQPAPWILPRSIASAARPPSAT